MKKLTAVFCATMALAMGVTGFAACNKENEEGKNPDRKTVMNVSLNPEVEFVLDGNDKVVTVNALNEEGNLIISAEAFENVEGKTAEEAAKLFVEVSKETGYLVSGSVKDGENEINISLSGDTKAAEELYNDVKTKISEYLDAEKITASVEQAAAITEEQLKALVAECTPYIETAQMEYEELVNALAESRKETAEFYSQELKNAYYEAKAFAMEQAELETLKTHLSGAYQVIFDATNKFYTKAVETIESTRMTLLVNEDSIYQKALAAFRKVKAEYLKARNEFSLGNAQITVEITEEQLAALKVKVEEAEAALLKAGEDANKALDDLKATVTENYNKVVAMLEEQQVKASEHLEEISAKQKEKQTAFFTAFEENYAEAINAAESNWANMKTELENGSETKAE